MRYSFSSSDIALSIAKVNLTAIEHELLGLFAPQTARQVSRSNETQSASHLPKHSTQEPHMIARKLLAARAQLLNDAISVGNA